MKEPKEVGLDTTIGDIMYCPKCDSDDTYEYDTDEIEFSYDGTGHYFVDCTCNNCKHTFRRYIHFKYQIISYS